MFVLCRLGAVWLPPKALRTRWAGPLQRCKAACFTEMGKQARHAGQEYMSVDQRLREACRSQHSGEPAKGFHRSLQEERPEGHSVLAGAGAYAGCIGTKGWVCNQAKFSQEEAQVKDPHWFGGEAGRSVFYECMKVSMIEWAPFTHLPSADRG